MCNEKDWRAIPSTGHKYEASDLGEIRNGTTGKVLTPGKKENGYLFFQSWSHNISKFHYIHRAVYEAFARLIPYGMEINHKNGDKTDNNLGNLEVVTHNENKHHASLFLPNNKGELHGNSILKTNDVLKIRELAERYTGRKTQRISRELKLPYCAVRRVLNGECWGWLNV